MYLSIIHKCEKQISDWHKWCIRKNNFYDKNCISTIEFGIGGCILDQDQDHDGQNNQTKKKYTISET